MLPRSSGPRHLVGTHRDRGRHSPYLPRSCRHRRLCSPQPSLRALKDERLPFWKLYRLLVGSVKGELSYYATMLLFFDPFLLPLPLHD